VSDPRISEYVEAKMSPIERGEDRELPMRLAQKRQQHSVSGGFRSSGRVRAEDEVHLDSIRLRALARARLRVQAHRSYGVPIEDVDLEEVSQTVAAMIATELAEREADPYRGAYATDSTEAYQNELEGVLADALDELRAAQMEQGMPKREQVPGTVFIFNSPNFGTVAAQIGTVNVSSRPEEFRAILKDLLEVTKKLGDETASAEARDLILGLANEAEKGPNHSRGMVAHAIERLRAIFSFTADVTTIAVNLGAFNHLDQLVQLFQSLIGSR